MSFLFYNFTAEARSSFWFKGTLRSGVGGIMEDSVEFIDRVHGDAVD